MDAVAALPTLPFQDWDALICTSRASRAAVQVLLDRQMEFLKERTGAKRFPLPQLPVIPLGVDCDAQALRMSRREQARARFDLEADELAVLFVGRLSFHAKANPVPMYLALERLAQRHRVALIECGWASNPSIDRAFADARAELCPSVRSIRTDGRQEQDRTFSWAAADIFCSLTDNIQETFGLTPIEAMAAALPVVVTDWDGYKDTVRHGIDGFSVPTLTAPPGAGLEPALRHALEIDSYDAYIGHISTTAVVDIDATVRAFEHLTDPDRRHQMGRAGARRAREVYDWQVVVRAYEELWRELAKLRLDKRDTIPATLGRQRGWVARPDPYELFASFPSRTLSGAWRVRQKPGIGLRDVGARLRLKTAILAVFPEVDESTLFRFWQEIGSNGDDVSTFLRRQTLIPGTAGIRALLLLAKLDLISLSEP
ncbi:glycosyltransferase family 4 protein [Microvirga sp. BT291]|nr:glycosyltransferase family 4 protein [Microvirga pudoricolor]